MQSKARLSILMTLIYSIILPFLTGADIAFCNSFTFNSSSEAYLYGVQGDLNGDGIEDIVATRIAYGILYIILGRRAAFPSNFDLKNATNADGVFKITGKSDESRYYVNPLGDINNDGIDDIIVANMNGHAVYIFYGKKNWFDLELTSFVSGTHGVKFTNSAGTLIVRYAGKAGDVNGDNINDIMIINEAPSYTCYIIFGKNPMSDLDVANMKTGEGGDGIKIIGSLSFQLSYFGDYGADFNADGYQDIIIGAYKSNKVLVIFGGPGLKNNVTLDSMSTTVGITIYTTSYGFFGFNFANVHDMNGDGIDDLLLAHTSSRRVYLVYGRENPGNICVDTMTSKDGIIMSSDLADTSGGNIDFGRDLQFAGDINQDGMPDAFVSSDSRTYIIYGGSSLNSQSSIIFGATSTQILENSPGNVRKTPAKTFLADLNGDGVKEFYYSGASGAFYQLLRGYTTTPGGTCHTCLESCLNCLDANTCTACAQGETLQGFTCSCTSNQYFSTSTNTCTACSTLDPLCIVCRDENTCTKCSGGKSPSGKVCQECNVGYFLSNDKCSACPANCKVCSDSSTCQECFSDYVLENSACVDDISLKGICFLFAYPITFYRVADSFGRY